MVAEIAVLSSENRGNVEAEATAPGFAPITFTSTPGMACNRRMFVGAGLTGLLA